MLVRLKKYFLLTAALVIGLVCAIGVNKEKPEQQAVEPVATEEVFVAAIDMDAGEQLDLTKLRVMKVAVDRLLDVTPVQDLQSINGQFAARRLLVGDPITTEVLQDTDHVAVETLMPGYSTVTVNSHLDPLLVGLMESGCSVDIAGIIPTEENDSLGITRLASNCQVMGLNTPVDSDDLIGDLTLLVKAELVDPILLAMEAGALHLSLTGAADEGYFPSGMITTLDTLQQQLTVEVDMPTTNQSPEQVDVKVTESNNPMESGSAEQPVVSTVANQEQLDDLAAEVAKQVSDQVVQRIADRMDEVQATQNDVKPANVVAQTPTPVPNYREMEVITPDGVLRYVWKTRDSEPIIIANEKQETKTSQVLEGDPAKIALQK